MKSMLMAAVGFLAGVLLAAEAPTMTLEKARGQIASVVAEPEKMGEVMQALSPEDQNAFLAEVNAAIAALPGSTETKTAKFLAVDREALLAAKKGNLPALVSTVFSSVTLESLTVLSERYGEDLFNRAADASKTFTDEQFVEIACATVGEVQKKCTGLADAGPRDILAIYLFEKASNGTPADLEDRLLEVVADANVRAVAKKEWLPAANGSGSNRFSAMLSSVSAGRAPNTDVVLSIAGPQLMTALLADVANGVTDSKGGRVLPFTRGEYPSERGLTTAGSAASDKGLTIAPKTSDPAAPWNPSKTRTQVEREHPGGYSYQTTRN